MTEKQRYQRGDVVMAEGPTITTYLGEQFTHRKTHPPREAIVMASYAEQFGRGSNDTYTVMFTADGSEWSWYDDDQLTFIRSGGEAAIQEAIAAREARRVHETDLAWVVANWPKIRENTPGPTAHMLMARVGITEPWGSQGEGMALYANWRQTFAALDEALLTGDVGHVEMVLATTRLSPIDYRIS